MDEPTQQAQPALRRQLHAAFTILIIMSIAFTVYQFFSMNAEQAIVMFIFSCLNAFGMKITCK